MDISYAASSPLKTHTQTIDQYMYCDIVRKDYHFACYVNFIAFADNHLISLSSLFLFLSLSLVSLLCVLVNIKGDQGSGACIEGLCQRSVNGAD